MIRLFDAHCHLQDPRIFSKVPKLINTALESGILHFAVNGVSEKDWHLVKEMSDNYPSVIPSFGLHPWFIMDRTPNWLTSLREFFDANPSAAVGEIGLDKGSHGKTIDFNDQVETFRLQLQLAKELKRPASVHCVRAFGDLLDILKSVGPFPEGVILHSYLGSAEMVPEFARLGAYFSFSGFLMAMKENKAKKMLKAVPSDRILLETDAPDALPKSINSDSLFSVEDQDSVPEGVQASDGHPKEMLNHPANIHFVLSYVASLLELSKEELAEVKIDQLTIRNCTNIRDLKAMTKLFDAHCHLQDPRISNKTPELIKTALENGVLHFAVNGVSEKDWHVVKEMSDNYPSVVPSFGLHPWFIVDRTSNWLSSLKALLKANPVAAVGEIGLDKGPLAKAIDFNDQVEVFRPQLQLAKELKRPVSVHCVDAFGELLDIMKSIGPFPEGVILHSYIGSAEMVPEFAKLGCYFSFSGHLMPMEETKAKKMLKAVPSDRILLETDAPDALPISKNSDCQFLVEEQDSLSDGQPKETLNQPANILFVLSYVASLLDLSKQELADVSYRNAMHLFSYEGSKIQEGKREVAA